MNQEKIMDSLLEAGNGYLFTSAVMENGISSMQLASYVKSRNMERIAHGVYISDDVWPDELYLLSQKNKNAIFSHETALFLHGLMEREPVRISMTVCPNYNATHLRKRGIRVYQVKDELFTLGICNVKTNFGNPVNVYDKERSICDIVKNRRNMDVQTFQTAMKEYMQNRDKKLPILMQYAQKLGIDEKMKQYVEVML